MVRACIWDDELKPEVRGQRVLTFKQSEPPKPLQLPALTMSLSDEAIIGLVGLILVWSIRRAPIPDKVLSTIEPEEELFAPPVLAAAPCHHIKKTANNFVCSSYFLDAGFIRSIAPSTRSGLTLPSIKDVESGTNISHITANLCLVIALCCWIHWTFC